MKADLYRVLSVLAVLAFLCAGVFCTLSDGGSDADSTTLNWTKGTSVSGTLCEGGGPYDGEYLYVGKSMTGSVPGVTFTYSENQIKSSVFGKYTYSGTPTAAGTYEISISASFGMDTTPLTYTIVVADNSYYTVKFSTDGTSCDSKTVAPGNSVTLPTTSKTGYNFLGWYTASSGGTKVTSPYTPTSSITLYAMWEKIPQYTVKFSTDGTSCDSKTVYEGVSVTLPTTSKTGYNFLGWYTASSGGTKVTSPYTPTSSITLYAHWEQKQYTVTFSTDGTSCDSKTVAAGNSVTLPSTSKDGHVFVGWFTSSSGGTKVTSPYTPTSSITLYAQWTEDTSSTVTITVDGQSVQMDNGKTVGDVTRPTKADYTFVGWYSESTLTLAEFDSTVLTDGMKLYSKFEKTSAIHTELTLTKGFYAEGTLLKASEDSTSSVSYGAVTVWSDDIPGITFTASGGDLMYAGTPTAAGTYIISVNGIYNKSAQMTYAYKIVVEEETYYTVELRDNGIYDTKQVKRGESVELPELSEEGYIFGGWADISGNIASSPYTPTSSITLYAKWTEIPKYTVTFDTNEGSAEDPQTHYVNTSITLPTPTKTASTFLGWFTASSGGTQVASPYTVTENITLYAHWSSWTVKINGPDEQYLFTLTFALNGETQSNITGSVSWYLDGESVHSGSDMRYQLSAEPSAGKHTVRVVAAITNSTFGAIEDELSFLVTENGPEPLPDEPENNGGNDGNETVIFVVAGLIVGMLVLVAAVRVF
jgi:uncharacterized repeat protein (TIGR02543 family)